MNTRTTAKKQLEPFYSTIAQLLIAIDNCRQSGNTEWLEKHSERLDKLCNQRLPSGSGFDAGSLLLLDKSTPDRLVIRADFHHMNEHGYYDGWTEHTVIVKPSLAFGFTLRVTGRNRNEIKDYIHDTFHHIMGEEILPR